MTIAFYMDHGVIYAHQLRVSIGACVRDLDLFAGGSIPLEALRLGCETYASD
jgi:adenine-specific DNA methylase